MKKKIEYKSSTCQISKDRRRRYTLRRVWDPGKPSVVWILLNPSTADAKKDDATIRKIVGFSDRWGYGSITVINLFSVRSTFPSEIPGLLEDHNESAMSFSRKEISILRNSSTAAETVVVAWGNGSKASALVKARSEIVLDILGACVPAERIKCLGKTAAGNPRHPVRLGYDTKLVAFGDE